MRDIKIDLRERLQVAEAAKARIERELNEQIKAISYRFKQDTNGLIAEIEAIQSLLDIENRRSGNKGQHSAAPEMPIKDFLVKAVKDGAKTKNELRDMANEAGYFRKGESPGRATHGQILQLTRSGKLMQKGENYIVGPDILG